MHHYKLATTSPRLFHVYINFMLFLGCLLVYNNPLQLSFWLLPILYVGLEYVLLFVLPKWLLLGEVSVTINDNSLNINWLRRVPLVRCEDKNILFSEIIHFEASPAMFYKKIGLTTRDYDSIVFVRYSNLGKPMDDMDRLIEALPVLLKAKVALNKPQQPTGDKKADKKMAKKQNRLARRFVALLISVSVIYTMLMLAIIKLIVPTISFDDSFRWTSGLSVVFMAVLSLWGRIHSWRSKRS